MTSISRGLLTIFLITAGFAAVQGLRIAHLNATTPARVHKEAKLERDAIRLDSLSKKQQLLKEYEEKKHLRSGATVYDRIYNTPDQSVTDLIERLAEASFPADWKCEVRVEEFTHFALLVFLPHNSSPVSPSTVASYLPPVLQYGGAFLSNVAIYERRHKCFAFFDPLILEEIKATRKLSSDSNTRALSLGSSFSRFDSVTVQCEELDSHLFVPIEVSGVNGITVCYALLDTGASITTLSMEELAKTGVADIERSPRKQFNTANGFLSCPVVQRQVRVGDVQRRIEVAVNQRDDLNLLGVNFFEGMEYIVDSGNTCIYIWEK